MRYSADELQRYLAAINDRDGTALAVCDFAAVKEQKYYILIAGECRLRALHILREDGCESCREKGKVRRGACYRKHLGSNRVEVKMFRGISVAEALGKQMSENNHTRPPEHEEAFNISWMFRTYRVIDPSITIRQFSRHIGRTPETVEKAIMFCQLPDAIRSAVARSSGQNPTTGKWQYIRYGHAIQIARLQLAGENEEKLLHWRDRVLHDMLSVPDMREQVNKRLVPQ